MNSKLKFITAMLIFGSIGIFVKNVDLPSAAIVQWRSIIGFISIILIIKLRKQSVDFAAIRKNAGILTISGIFVGCNWAFLFEAYNHVSVGMATIIYYFAPIIVFFLAPVLFKDKLTKLQIMGILAAVIGMILVNVQNFGATFNSGIIYALLSALFYAGLMISNRFVKGVTATDSTLVQLVIAAIIMTIYCTISTGQVLVFPETSDIIFVVFMGVVHTGLACSLYFEAMQTMKSQDVAIFSYIDPASALVFAAFFLSESLSVLQIAGAACIFGGTLFAQMQAKNEENV